MHTNVLQIKVFFNRVFLYKNNSYYLQVFKKREVFENVLI